MCKINFIFSKKVKYYHKTNLFLIKNDDFNFIKIICLRNILLNSFFYFDTFIYSKLFVHLKN